MHDQPETWTMCSDKSLESESCVFKWENGNLCPKFIYSRTGEKQGERPETWVYSLPFGQKAQSARAQENQQLLVHCRQILYSPHFSTDAEDLNHNLALIWSHPVPGAEDSLLFAPAYAIRTARSLWAHWNCKMCVLKIQSQLVLQDFMLQTLKTLNNNILSAFYVAPVNPEGLKALQKLYVVVAVKKLRNHCLSCLQEAEM